MTALSSSTPTKVGFQWIHSDDEMSYTLRSSQYQAVLVSFADEYHNWLHVYKLHSAEITSNEIRRKSSLPRSAVYKTNNTERRGNLSRRSQTVDTSCTIEFDR